MDDPTLDDMLRRSAPATAATDPSVEAPLLALVDDAEANARPARRRRRALWIAAIPALPALALGLTAGIQDRMVPDLTIPVSYTTDTGIPVSCSIRLFNGEIYSVEVSFVAVDYLRDQDWDGIGPRIYARALIEEADLTQRVQQDDRATATNSDGTVQPDAATIEITAWNIAEGHLVGGSVPETVLHPGDQWGEDSDCSGRLH